MKTIQEFGATGILVCWECGRKLADHHGVITAGDDDYEKTIAVAPGECTICGTTGTTLDFYKKKEAPKQMEFW